MPIEFACQQCGQTLRVPDEAAGKMARCPKCSHVSQAPESPVAPPTPTAPPPSAFSPPKQPYPAGTATTNASPTSDPFAGGVNPFRDDPVATPPGGTNPYLSPAASRGPGGGSGVTSQYTLSVVRGKVQGPAIALIIVGALNLLWLALFILAFVMQAQEDGIDNEDLLMVAFYVPVFLLKSIPVLYGGLQMMKLRNYWAAMTATIIAMVPCCCLVIEVPLAIWSLVVLSDYHVRAVFRQGPAAFQETGVPTSS